MEIYRKAQNQICSQTMKYFKRYNEMKVEFNFQFKTFTIQ
jgi:hypothetical protein